MVATICGEFCDDNPAGNITTWTIQQLDQRKNLGSAELVQSAERAVAAGKGVGFQPQVLEVTDQ